MKHDHANHGHDHHHDHREETLDILWGTALLETHTHGQAATVSLTLRPAAGTAIAFGEIVAYMLRLAEKAEAEGGIVGHIKALARQDDAFAHASVTAAGIAPSLDGDTSLEYGERADIQLVAIVLLVNQDGLARMCREELMER